MLQSTLQSAQLQIQARLAVLEATKDDYEPPSGYHLRELADLTHSSIDGCRVIENLVLDRLKNDSPQIKLKALKTIKYLCQNGRADFRIDFQRKNDEIRACNHYRGPPDPLRGDAPYAAVRDASKETMNAIFESASTASSIGSSRIVGFGSDIVSSNESPSSSSPSSISSSSSSFNETIYSLPESSSSGKRMVGFGNPAFDSSPQPSSLLDVVQEKIQNVFKKDNTPPAGFTSYNRPAPYSGATLSVAPSPQLPTATSSGKPRQKGQVGGTWGSDSGPSSLPTSNSSFAANSASGSFSSSSSISYESPAEHATQITSSTTDGAMDGEMERRLVEEITTPSGVRAAPSREVLTKFCKQAVSLSHPLLAALLDQKLLPQVHWQSQIKSLFVIEALLKCDVAASFLSYFTNHPQNIVQLKSCVTKSVAAQALKVCQELGLERAAPQISQSASPDLLDLGSTSTISTSSSVSSSSAFSFVDETPAPTASSASLDPMASLFADLQVKPASTTASAPAATSRALASSSIDLLNFGSDSKAQSGAASLDPLAFLTSPSPAPAPAPAPSSSFSFITPSAPATSTRTSAAPDFVVREARSFPTSFPATSTPLHSSLFTEALTPQQQQQNRNNAAFAQLDLFATATSTPTPAPSNMAMNLGMSSSTGMNSMGMGMGMSGVRSVSSAVPAQQATVSSSAAYGLGPATTYSQPRPVGANLALSNVNLASANMRMGAPGVGAPANQSAFSFMSSNASNQPADSFSFVGDLLKNQ